MKGNNTTNEQQLIRENEVMGKILTEIILHNDGISDERITRLFNQADWKERVDFSVKDEGEIGWKSNLSWISKPAMIFRRFKREKAELTEKNKELEVINSDYQKKVKKLEKELEESKLTIKSLETELEESDEIIESHEEALVKAKEWRERNEKVLKEEIDNQRNSVYKYTKKLAEKVVEVKNLKKEQAEDWEKSLKNSKKLVEETTRRKELQDKLHFATKPLPNLPKTPSKLEKTKTKIQHLIKKTKNRSQELIARIEVKSK